MNKWPSGWIEALLTHAGIPITPFAVQVMTLWHKSTPTAPWTNNPLGAPWKDSGHPRALNTDYALFPTTHAFREYMKGVLSEGNNRVLREALTIHDSHAKAWRAISGLKWPAAKTETDWPSALLDAIEDKYRAKLQTTEPSQRKGSGYITRDNTHGMSFGAVHSKIPSLIMTIRASRNALNSFNRRGY